MSDTMNSRSEMRRLAVQNPDALVEEIEGITVLYDYPKMLRLWCKCFNHPED